MNLAAIPEPFLRLALALAIGFLVGMERGWRDRGEMEGGRTAGLRTFSLIGLAGGLAGILQSSVGPAAFVVIGIGSIGAVAAYKWRENATENSHSVTTPVAAAVVFALGALAVLGDMALASAGGVATAGLLALRVALHDWLRRITWEELRATLMLLAMTAIVLPVLPDRTVDPWGTLNPHAIWLATILIGAVSFAGYVAVKVIGKSKGILVAGAAGGLVASTAVTLTNARRARDFPEATRLLAGGTAVAGAVSILRALAIALLLRPSFAGMLAAPMAAAAVGFLAAAALAARDGAEDGDGAEMPLANPFEPMTAIRFGLFLAAVLAASKILADTAGAAGYLAFAAASGLADVDAVVVSAGRLAGTGIDGRVAGLAILTAVGANIVAKAVYAVAVGGWRHGRVVAAASVMALAAGYAGAVQAGLFGG